MATLNAGGVAGLPDSHRNSPLAPSQELAYRQKCVDLKRRLSEIEANNDSIRQRLARERHFHDKMRLNRAILFQHMKGLVEKSSTKRRTRKMDKIRQDPGGRMSGVYDGGGNGGFTDESSDMTSNDEMEERDDRPFGVKRARDGTPRSMAAASANNTTVAAAATNSAVMPTYHSSGLPHIAPANNAYSSPPGVEPGTSLRTTSAASNVPLLPQRVSQQVHHPSQTPAQQQPMAPALAPSASVESALPPPPVRPIPPFDQFTTHLVPQLQADNIPHAEIGPKIRETWNEIGEVGQEPWQRKYREEMMAYERAMDEWKRAQREGSRGNKFVNGSGGGFSAVNR